MQLQHLPRTATADDVAAHVREHGYAVIDELAPPELVDRIEREVEPYLAVTPFGEIEELGLLTRRTSALVARVPPVRELILDELFLGVMKNVLSHSENLQLSLTEIVALSPGAKAQFLHQDQLLFDGYPFLPDYEVYCNSLWALSDYTEEMGECAGCRWRKGADLHRQSIDSAR